MPLKDRQAYRDYMRGWMREHRRKQAKPASHPDFHAKNAVVNPETRVVNPFTVQAAPVFATETAVETLQYVPVEEF
jgi:hypothetical protein